MFLEEGGRRVGVRAEGNKMMDVEIGEICSLKMQDGPSAKEYRWAATES